MTIECIHSSSRCAIEMKNEQHLSIPTGAFQIVRTATETGGTGGAARHNRGYTNNVQRNLLVENLRLATY